jgi:hypothetical protein
MVQSPGSQRLLQEASKRFATLYNIQADDATMRTFLTARLAFKNFDLCGKTEATIYLRNESFRKTIFTNIILPMLKFQEEHNEKVKNILKKLFEIEEGSLHFSKDIVKGGLQAINEVAHEAFQLLVNYYLKSEAYYIRGILLFENNRGKDFFSFST